LGSEQVVNLKELADLLVQVYGEGEYRLSEFPSQRKRIDIGDYYADSRHICEMLGWEPQVSLSAGLEQTLHYFSKHKEQYL
ncbi:MAG: NAD(P)-dependent oxidoreductase, partial [Chloroflexi bacterium]